MTGASRKEFIKHETMDGGRRMLKVGIVPQASVPKLPDVTNLGAFKALRSDERRQQVETRANRKPDLVRLLATLMFGRSDAERRFGAAPVMELGCRETHVPRLYMGGPVVGLSNDSKFGNTLTLNVLASPTLIPPRGVSEA